MTKARTSQQGQPAAGVRPLAAVSCCAGRLLRRFWNVGIGHERPSPKLSLSPGRKLERRDFFQGLASRTHRNIYRPHQRKKKADSPVNPPSLSLGWALQQSPSEALCRSLQRVIFCRKWCLGKTFAVFLPLLLPHIF